MNFKYIVAIVRPEVVPSLEVALRRIGIGGITLTKVKGFGEYKNFFTENWLTDHTKVEILTDESNVDTLLQVLLDLTHSDIPGEGVVAVIPTEKFLHLRTGTETLPHSGEVATRPPTPEQGG